MRSPPMRLEWYIASSASLMISSDSCVCGSLSASPIEAVRKISRSLKAIGARMVLRMVAGKPRKCVLRLQDPGQPPRQRQQDRIADRDADGIVDLLEAVEIDHHQRRPQVRHGL